MDSAITVVEMSPLCVPRKRKSVEQRSGAAYPDGAQPFEHTSRQDSEEERLSEGAEAQPGTEKRYEDLQSVSMATVVFATTSCAVMSSSSEASSKAPPTAALPLRTGTRVVWSQEAVQGHRDPGSSSPEGGPELLWVCSSDAGDRQRECSGSCIQNHSWTNSNQSRGNIWRPDMNMKKVQRGQGEGHHPGSDYPQPPGGAHSSEAAGPTPTGGHGGQRQPSEAPHQKTPPTFPPGSEEERWQLQITARGRATCPKCRSVSRKTVEGLKKHMENCRLQPFTCQHCGKQLKSSTGMKYHIMADHSHLPSTDVDDRATKDKLRKVLKRLGKLKCSKEGCGAAFTSIMGYVYHMRKCGKEQSELEKMLLSCSHCGKNYRSKAGLEYHLKSEHAPTPCPPEDDESLKNGKDSEAKGTPSGRVQRASAQVANFHLAEIANNELPKDWPKRKFQSDLVPDDKKLKYARPGLPAFSQEVLRKWKNEVKLHRKVQCPNQGCACTYTSVSGLKAHLGLCTKGDFQAGKYRCLICGREFHSESGVKYHITSVHSQEWFVTNKKASKKFEKFLRTQQEMDQHHHHLHQLHHHHHPHLHPPPAGEAHVLQFTPLTVWVQPNHDEDSPGPEQAPIDGDVLEEEETQQM